MAKNEGDGAAQNVPIPCPFCGNPIPPLRYHLCVVTFERAGFVFPVKTMFWHGTIDGESCLSVSGFEKAG